MILFQGTIQGQDLFVVGEGETYSYTDFSGYSQVELAGGTVTATLSGNTEISHQLIVRENTTSSFDINAHTFNLTGVLTGSGTIDKATGNGQLHFSGNASGFTGTIRNSNNWISIRYPQAASSRATYDLTGGGMVLTPQASSDLFSLGMLTGSQTVRPGAQAATGTTLQLRIGETNKSGTFSGSIQDYSINSTTASVEKAGTGTWILEGANYYTGATKVTGGTLQLGDSSSGTLSSQTAITVSGGGTLAMNNTNSIWSNSLTLNGGTLVNNMSDKNLIWNGNVTLTGVNTIRATKSNIFLRGPINLSGITSIYATDFLPEISGKATGDGTFRYTDHSIAGHQVHFRGDLSEFAGRIEIASGGGFIGIFQTNLSKTTLHSDGGNFFFQTPSTTDTVYKVGNISSGTTEGTFRPGANSVSSSLTLETGYANTDALFSGQLNNYYGMKILSVTKVGTGTWTVTGDQLYTGDTTVAEGALNLMGTLSASNVAVKTGATLTGTGSITRNLRFEKDSILQVTDPTEKLQVQGVFSADNSFLVDFLFDDYLSYKGETITFLETVDTSQNWLSSMQFDFSNIGGASIWSYGFTDGDYWIRIDDAAVPEPATWLLGLLGMASVLYMARRKRQGC